jgi:hypothetical protein
MAKQPKVQRINRQPRPDQPLMPLMQYDIYAVAFSGGKDSVAWMLPPGPLVNLTGRYDQDNRHEG